MLHIGNFATTDLASRFGTPLYVYDAAVIRRQMANVKRAFSELPLRPFYAMGPSGKKNLAFTWTTAPGVGTSWVPENVLSTAKTLSSRNEPYPFVTDAILCFMFIAGSRLAERGLGGLLRAQSDRSAVPGALIVGAGDAGNNLLRELRRRDVFVASSQEQAEQRLKECTERLEDFADRVYEHGGERP